MKSIVVFAAAAWLVSVGMAPGAEPVPANDATATPAAGTVTVRADTIVRIELAESLSSFSNYRGNTFAIRLAEPIIVDGAVLVPAGTPGVGEIISSGRAGPAGQAGKLVLAVRYLDYKGRHIPLHGLGLSRTGDDQSNVRTAAMAAGVVSPGIGIIGAALSGDEATVSMGAQTDAKLVSDVELSVLRPATPADQPQDRPAAARLIDGIGAPPTGKGQIVFFRPTRRLSSRFTLMEGATSIAELAGATYVVLQVEPGAHTFRADGKPDADTLTLEVGAGETYYVQEATIGGAFITAPVLYLRDQTAFASQSNLKPAKSTAPKT